jgi:ABC-type multidrug transport system ATPase subunit
MSSPREPWFKIEFRHVSLSFDDQTVLDGVSFTVWPGELKGILGGSGKSTVLKLALGLIPPFAARLDSNRASR